MALLPQHYFQLIIYMYQINNLSNLYCDFHSFWPKFFISVLFLIEFSANNQAYQSKFFLTYIPKSTAMSFIKSSLSFSKAVCCPSFELWAECMLLLKYLLQLDLHHRYPCSSVLRLVGLWTMFTYYNILQNLRMSYTL